MAHSKYYGEDTYRDEHAIKERNTEWEAWVDNLPTQTDNKYVRIIKGVDMDVYDVLKGFNVTCPAMQHAIKKMLCSGLRGYKGTSQDKEEAIASIKRSIELDAE
jgi:hypothetical protein